LLLRENFLADENLSERRAVVLVPLSRQRDRQLVLGYQSPLKEELAQSKFTGHHRHTLNTQPGPARGLRIVRGNLLVVTRTRCQSTSSHARERARVREC
jgi:hypothetical protein